MAYIDIVNQVTADLDRFAVMTSGPIQMAKIDLPSLFTPKAYIDIVNQVAMIELDLTVVYDVAHVGISLGR